MCAGFAYLGCALIRRLRRSYPNVSNSMALGCVFVLFLVLDGMIETFAIPISHAYAFAKTYGPITLFAGKMYQFPINEAMSVAALALGCTILAQSAHDDPNGVSFIEHGYQRFRPGLQTPVRVLAFIAAVSAIILFLYHIPLNWFGVIGDSVAALPSYMTLPR
jgi:hypothetical protein